MTAIPLVDLAAQHREVVDDVLRGLAETMDSCDFVGGKAVEAFEREYAELLGVPYCVGVANGTDALELALRAVGVRPGDEVVLPANTFVATAEAVCRMGARPVLVDVDARYLLLDPDAVRAAVTGRTRAVVPVHLYGQAAPVELFGPELAAREIPVVEDAAQAQGARRLGRPAGVLGAVAGTSFYPGKNLGAYGDAGAVLTASAETARSVRLLGNHGSAQKYVHESLGFNSRLDTMQAVVLRAKLSRLARWNGARRRAADLYDRLLAPLEQVLRPATMPGNEHVWHLYVVPVPDRDAVLQRLNAAGIGAGVHDPLPVHLQPAFADLGYARGAFPVAEAAAARILSLPLYPGIEPEQQARVVGELARALP
ncbi:MAG: DegT/DnrJ/EryC1/StrS family aminotransferase [Nocardioidaceae bacterium]